MVQIRNMYSQGVSAALFTSSSQSLLIPDVKTTVFTFTAENLGWQQEL